MCRPMGIQDPWSIFAEKRKIEVEPSRNEELIMAIVRTSRSVEPASRRMSNRECRDWLSSHHEGRLGYDSGRGPRSLVVSYAIADDAIMMRLPDYNDAVHYAPGAEVRLDVDGPAPDGRDAVRVIGTAIRTDDDLSAPNPFAEEWPQGVATSVVRVPMTRVEGLERR